MDSREKTFPWESPRQIQIAYGDDREGQRPQQHHRETVARAHGTGHQDHRHQGCWGQRTATTVGAPAPVEAPGSASARKGRQARTDTGEPPQRQRTGSDQAPDRQQRLPPLLAPAHGRTGRPRRQARPGNKSNDLGETLPVFFFFGEGVQRPLLLLPGAAAYPVCWRNW